MHSKQALRSLASKISSQKMNTKTKIPIPFLHKSSSSSSSSTNPRWVLPITIASIISLLLLLFLTTLSPLSLFPNFSILSPPPSFLESKLHPIALSPHPPPPKLAYLISGSSGDGLSLIRTLQALYHPHNYYVVHLDLEAPMKERLIVKEYVETHQVFKIVRNVRMITKANLITYRGVTMVANTLHAAAILLREGGDWDWFVNLSASDYPLVTQDDLLSAFSKLSRDLNFIDHTSDIGWKEYQRAKPVIIDPGLYMSKKQDVFWIPQRRSVPTAFKLYTGAMAWKQRREKERRLMFGN